MPFCFGVNSLRSNQALKIGRTNYLQQYVHGVPLYSARSCSATSFILISHKHSLTESTEKWLLPHASTFTFIGDPHRNGSRKIYNGPVWPVSESKGARSSSGRPSNDPFRSLQVRGHRPAIGPQRIPPPEGVPSGIPREQQQQGKQNRRFINRYIKWRTYMAPSKRLDSMPATPSKPHVVYRRLRQVQAQQTRRSIHQGALTDKMHRHSNKPNITHKSTTKIVPSTHIYLPPESSTKRTESKFPYGASGGKRRSSPQTTKQAANTANNVTRFPEPLALVHFPTNSPELFTPKGQT